MKEYCFGIICLFTSFLAYAHNRPLSELPPTYFYSWKNSYVCTSQTNSNDSLIHISVAGHEVDIIFPNEAPRGTLLIFPGWNFPRQDWCQKSSLCREAKQKGYVLVLPEMGKSLYSSSVFPETDSDFLKYPSLDWLRDQLIPHLQEQYELLLPNAPNYLLGLSTGGRGVALMALAKPDLFRAG
ncbi:MAG: hypothetical protein AAFU64_04690, partial [Bacteroidota bacterium]